MPHINGFDERQKDMWTVEPVFADWGGVNCRNKPTLNLPFLRQTRAPI